MVWNCLLISTSNGTTTGWKGCRESSEVCHEYNTILAQSVEKIERSEWHEAFCKISCNNWTSEPTNFKACRQRLYCYNRRYKKCFEAEKHQETPRRRLKEAGGQVQPTNINTTFDRKSSISWATVGSSYIWYRLESNRFLWWDYYTPESTETARLAFVRKEKSSPKGEESGKDECVTLLF